MANRFSQIFTLKDIFNNPKLKGKLPLVNYKEQEREDGKISYRTHMKTVTRQVYESSVRAARPFYRPLIPIKTGDIITLTGQMTGEHDEAVNAVYRELLGIKGMLMYTANNADVIRNALKESEKAKRKYGIDAKLYLRAKSMQQIEGMTKRELVALMDDIMENIYYGDNFPMTQKKYGLEQIPVNSPYNYEQRQLRWKFKVGDN